MVSDESPRAPGDAVVDPAAPRLPGVAREETEHEEHHQTQEGTADRKDDLEHKASDAEAQGVGGWKTEAPDSAEEEESEGDPNPALDPGAGTIFVLMVHAGTEEEGNPGGEVDDAGGEEQAEPVWVALWSAAGGGGRSGSLGAWVR